MDFILFLLCLLVFLLGLALFSNQARSRQNLPFELKPNCLLTRWPVLFVTGHRSLFYFKSYWNSYTPFLAEHGYEVFTLHLPWKSTEQRRQRLVQFLEQQENQHRHFHLFVDSNTLSEFADLLRQHKSAAIKSLTEVHGPEHPRQNLALSAFPLPLGEVLCHPLPHPSFFMRLTYHLHTKMLHLKSSPSLSTLGAVPQTAITNGLLLLERAQTLAEMDLRED
ncbi:MAG: hypothetical protein HUU57_13595 [Bdellovibrio sp.]|nr:hypothetical protein [Bdellovibrio sp.]